MTARRAAEAAGRFEGSPVDLADGYIHFSTADQVRETAARHFFGQTRLLLIAVDADALAGDLAKLGWTQADMQLFSDERALSRAPPEKVCQLVHDWFAAQLAIKDQDIQLRLLVDSLKPVVAG